MIAFFVMCVTDICPITRGPEQFVTITFDMVGRVEFFS
jgi:hypothetical protein